MTLTRLLDAALEHRRDLLARCAAADTDAYRVFHGGAEGRPGLTLDRYGALVLAQTFRAPLDDAGQSLGIGFIEKLDFERGEIEIVANSVAPAPIAAIALGSLYVSPQGIELGETKPYEL